MNYILEHSVRLGPVVELPKVGEKEDEERSLTKQESSSVMQTWSLTRMMKERMTRMKSATDVVQEAVRLYKEMKFSG